MKQTQDRTVIKMWSKVLIVADQPILRLGLVQLLSKEPDIEVRGEAETVSDTLVQVEALRPDLAVISLPLEGKLHPGWLLQLKAKHAPLKILAGIRMNDPTVACHVIRAGADGCIHWGAPVAELVKATREVLRGELYLEHRVSKRVLQCAVGNETPDGDRIGTLSDRELYIFGMIGQGMTTQQIATALDLSPRTIESHRKKIKLKLQARNAVELNRQAFQWWRENS